MTPSRPDIALVLGGASCVWDDVAALEAMYGGPWDGLVIAANDIGCHWPRELHHWVSLHPAKFEKWQALRIAEGQPACAFQTWGRELRMKEPKITDHTRKAWNGGSSGMFAVQVAVDLLCRRVVLCGVPLTMTPHFGESKEAFGPQWAAANGHWRAWPREKERMLGIVKSMSGRTQELLGAPTLEWLTS